MGVSFSHTKCKLLVPHELQKFSHENWFGSMNRFVYKIAVVFFLTIIFSDFLITLNTFTSLSVTDFLFALFGPGFLCFVPGKQLTSVFSVFFQGKAYHTSVVPHHTVVSASVS